MKRIILALLICFISLTSFAQSSQIFDVPVVMIGKTNQINNPYIIGSLYLNNTNILDMINAFTNTTETLYLHKDATNQLMSGVTISNRFTSYMTTNTYNAFTNNISTNFTAVVNTNTYNLGKACLIARKTTNQTIGYDAVTVFTSWTTNTFNENNSFTNSTGFFTVKVPGFYVAGASLRSNGGENNYPTAADTTRAFIILVNSNINISAFNTGLDQSSQAGYSCYWSGYLTNGNTLATAMFQTATGQAYPLTTVHDMQFWIIRIKQ